MSTINDLPVENFFQFIDEKCNKAQGIVRCNSCGGNDWIAYNDGKSMVSFMIPTTKNLVEGIPSYILSCTNCGELRFFDAKVFHK